MIFCLGLLGMNVAQGMLGGVDPQTSYAQKNYDAAKYNLCVAEQTLANAKLSDYFHGFINLSDEDIIRLKNKKEDDCSLITDAFQ